ncbi:MAG: L,D-transpeptidase family protein [Dorea sp.]|nr:L,D-transpeptidase family protein [Dorea sp.]
MAGKNKKTKKADDRIEEAIIELYDENEPDEKKDQEKKKRRRGKKGGAGRKILLSLGVVTALLAAAYFGMAMFFNSHFMFDTQINGVDFSLKDVSEVESYLKKQVADYTLTLEESDGSREIIKGSDIDIEFTTGERIKQLAEGQQKLFWIKSLWEPSEIEAKVGVKYNAEKLNAVIDGLKCMDEEKQKASKNAYPAFKDGKFEVVPEVIGTKIDGDKFRSMVSKMIDGFQNHANLREEDCYILPKYTSESKEVLEAAEKMNSYLGAKITYDFGSETETVDSAVISEWVKVNKKKMKVSFNKDDVKEYIKKLADKYDTKYKAKQFTTADGDTVKVEGGSYGWLINQDAEYEQLIKDIKTAQVVTREPKYTSKAASHQGAGVGSTYAEVDLTDQHMYFIKGGKVVLETDVVTGNPNKGNATPQGIYTLSYKTRNATLRGEKKANGEYSYETPVKYWMPFNGGIGFHDATWQPTFGGDWYKGHGSHGCVNMPEEKAAKLYELIGAGIPVVCHY